MERISKQKPKLDVRDLELVLAIAGSGSTVKAASELHVTQSAVSRGLILAEEKLGMRLFERTSRGLRPTSAGEKLVQGAGALLAQLVELEQRLDAPPSGPVKLRLVCECYTAYRWLPTALTDLRRNLPKLSVSLAIEHTSDPVAGLLAREVDIALLTTATVRPPLLESPLFSDEVVFLVGKSHPLAHRPSIVARDLLEHPIITSAHTPERESRWFMRRVFGATKLRIEPLLFPLTEAIVDATRAGMGIGVLSEWMATPYLDAGDPVLKRLRGGALRRGWRMAFRPEVEGPARKLAAALEHAAPHVV